ncbi:DUF1311 domain-containing protein [Thalassotalea euphylliae]|uniref:DUF1311 domain-containing protein n=1 Tax=Thalassotalea euphylliae TaxID=1655234 RepID=A0A3E0TPW9_9GAMM|nr:lysozyme inhibitor LprI family protein [Thalassotalea euphylliae]REL26574.1 DUF1311 domain-containing protein [Thalassotalea euphylliae]
MKQTYLALLLMALTTAAMDGQAKSLNQCDNISDDIAHSRCLDGVKEAVDRELQTWINNQVFVLEERAMKTGRKSALNMFKRANSDFIKYRENNCRWQYLAISPASSASTAYKTCYINLSKSRITELSKLNSE